MGVKPGPVNDMVIVSARPKERKLVEGIRSNLYKGVSSPLPEFSTLRVDEVYCGLSSEVAPLITTLRWTLVLLWLTLHLEKCKKEVCYPIRYQQKVPKTCPHTDALQGYRLGPSACSFVYTEHQQHHMISLATTLETAHRIANSTKEQSFCIEWHQLRRPCVTSSKFREICHTRAQSSAESLAKRLLRPSHQTADMRRGLEMEPAAVEEYCRAREVKISEGTHTLRKSHPYFWQIQGQILTSG